VGCARVLGARVVEAGQSDLPNAEAQLLRAIGRYMRGMLGTWPRRRTVIWRSSISAVCLARSRTRVWQLNDAHKALQAAEGEAQPQRQARRNATVLELKQSKRPLVDSGYRALVPQVRSRDLIG